MLRRRRRRGFSRTSPCSIRALLDRTSAFYLASPANPQGAVASAPIISRGDKARAAARFLCFRRRMLFGNLPKRAPRSALEVAARMGGFDRVLVFNSLSKRSNAPGLRSGFIAGDAAFLKDYLQYRNVASPQIPMPIQYASAALWSDEAHVARKPPPLSGEVRAGGLKARTRLALISPPAASSFGLISQI